MRDWASKTEHFHHDLAQISHLHDILQADVLLQKFISIKLKILAFKIIALLNYFLEFISNFFKAPGVRCEMAAHTQRPIHSCTRCCYKEVHQLVNNESVGEYLRRLHEQGEKVRGILNSCSLLPRFSPLNVFIDKSSKPLAVIINSPLCARKTKAVAKIRVDCTPKRILNLHFHLNSCHLLTNLINGFSKRHLSQYHRLNRL